MRCLAITWKEIAASQFVTLVTSSCRTGPSVKMRKLSATAILILHLEKGRVYADQLFVLHENRRRVGSGLGSPRNPQLNFSTASVAIAVVSRLPLSR